MTQAPVVPLRRRRARLRAGLALSAISVGALAILPASPVVAAGPGTITTIAGQATSGDGLPAPQATLFQPRHLAFDSAGQLYVADTVHNRVRKVSPSGVITTIAGRGEYGFAGDGGPATSAALACPSGVAVDAAGAVYIADTCNQRVRKVSPSGVITTIAGTGAIGGSGDGGPATAATLQGPEDVAVDAGGNVFVADMGNGRVRRISTSGVITTAAGNGVRTSAGDGGPAAGASMIAPASVTFDGAGNLYIADATANRVRKVSTSGIISTVAGNGTEGFGGDGGPATSASLFRPYDVSIDGDGNLYIADSWNHRVRKVSARRHQQTQAGTISTIAGSGTEGFAGDGGPATSAQLYEPRGVEVGPSGDLYVSDFFNDRVRKVSPSGVITTAVGSGGFSGDGGAATDAALNRPSGLARDGAGNVYIVDGWNQRVRKVSPSGVITTLAGNGSRGFAGDGGPATDASFGDPTAVAVDAAGNVFIADTWNSRVRKVSPSGVITTVAGSGAFGSNGDGGPATAAALALPAGLAVDGAGNLFIADMFENRVRKVSPSGTISTVAGGGLAGDGIATLAALHGPRGLAIGPGGDLFIAEDNGAGVRKLSGMLLTTVAGGGLNTGCRGSARAANLGSVFAVAVDAAGSVYLSTPVRDLVCKVSPDGTMSVVAGTGGYGPVGDGGQATQASVLWPQGLVLDGHGGLLIAEGGRSLVRRVEGVTATATAAA